MSEVIRFGEYVTKGRRGRVAVVRFDQGSAKNTMPRAVMRALVAAARSFEDDHETSAIVLTGNAQAFCVGFDLKDPESAKLAAAGLSERRQAQTLGARLCRAWAELAPVTIVAIEGYCIGGGVALAVACDLRIAGEGARFAIPEIDRGMNMTWGSLPRLVALVGPAQTKRLVVLARMTGASHALDIGLIDELVPDGKAFEAAMKLAEEIALKPPLPVRMNKSAVNAATALADVSAHADFDQFMVCQGSEDFREGVASFIEKRPPRFTGR